MVVVTNSATQGRLPTRQPTERLNMSVIERILMFLFRHRDIVKDGKLYLRRFYITPRNWRYRVFIHHIFRSDEDRDPHDHPWSFFTLMLKGWYCEKHYDQPPNPISYSITILKPLRFLFRKATDTHRLYLYGGPVWTLVIAGKTVRPWGFWTYMGWVPWRKYLHVPPGKDEV